MSHKFLSFCAGLVLCVSAAVLAVCGIILNEGLFARALRTQVAAQGAVSETDADAFAEATIGYLAGRSDAWTPQVLLEGAPLSVTPAFSAHMVTVKRGVQTSLRVGAAGLILALALLLLGRRGLSAHRCMAGSLTPLVLLALALAWAGIDFQSFWTCLHYAFIPDGVFSDAETVNGVMRLFPLELFGEYLLPGALALGCAALAALVLPPLLMKIFGARKRSR